MILTSDQFGVLGPDRIFGSDRVLGSKRGSPTATPTKSRTGSPQIRSPESRIVEGGATPPDSPPRMPSESASQMFAREQEDRRKLAEFQKRQGGRGAGARQRPWVRVKTAREDHNQDYLQQ